MNRLSRNLLFVGTLLLLLVVNLPLSFAQKKKAKLPPDDLPDALLATAQYSFSLSGLKGAVLTNPTSLQFGPDNRLYVSEQGGLIKAFTIKRNAANDYSVTATEIINLVNQIPNHNDDGSLAPSVSTRQVTGILLRGTAAQPIIYVTSSDSRIGGAGVDLNLDTNSGIVSMLTKTGSTWAKMDLVRGLPRSEENHAPNGLQLNDQTGILYIAVGGFTNAGSPSTNFSYTCEYALSAAILSIDLNAINAMSTKGSGNTAYKYNLPTLDDPTRTNNADGTDVNDPFGGNDGLNQAKIVTGGPVQIYAPGFRIAYDLLITKTPGKAGRMYAIDNGANQGWGGYPQNEGTANVTNNYVTGEPGSTTAGGNDAVVNNLDNLHYIGNVNTYTPGSLYGGHPNPTRANPSGAGLYTHDGTTGIWRTSKTGANPLPSDWPPLPVNKANPIEGNFQMPGVDDLAMLTFNSSTNGLAEYTASNFNGVLKGSLLAAGLNGDIYKISLTDDGTNTTNLKSATNKQNQDISFASGFGSQPLDIIAQGDNDIYPGTVWAATYESQAITIFEPQDFVICTGKHDNKDDDNDGYTNADEIDNATNPCSAASMPKDADHDHISDLNDPDDDNDGLADNIDYFPIDATNGLSQHLPIKYNLFSNDPGSGFFGVGFTGLMSNKKTDNDYIDLYDEDNLIAGGAAGAFSVVKVSTGDALGTLNSQENAFQLGFKPEAGSGPFSIKARMLGPFFNAKRPTNFQSQGIYLGTGDQSNYLKITLNANGGAGGIEVVNENADVPVASQFALPGGIPTSTIDLILSVNPLNGKVQPKYSVNGGPETNLGSPIQLGGALLNALQGTAALAVGIISTARGAATFTASWDYIYVTADVATATGAWQIINPTTGSPVPRIESAYAEAGDKFYLLGGRNFDPVQAYDPISKTWTTKAKPPIELHDFDAVTLNGLIYAAGAFTGTYPHETPVPQLYVYNSLTDKWLNGSLIPAARRRGAASTVVYKNKIYLLGGIQDGHWTGTVNWFDEFDPATNTWKTLPDAPRVRDHFQAVVVNDKIYVAGGRRTSLSTGEEFSLTIPQVDVFDFNTGLWTTLPTSANILTPRAGAAAALLGSEIIVIGGESTQSTANIETEALNTETNVWRKLANLQQRRHGMQAIESNNGVYVVDGAGNQGSGALLSSQEVFYMFNVTTPNGTALAQSTLSTVTTASFGSIATGADSNKIVTITNTGTNQSILVSSIAISGASSFSFNAPFVLPFVIAPGQKVDINVIFKPAVAGSQTATLTLNHSGQNATNTISLTGSGLIPIYRIHSGGAQITTSKGVFSADANFSPAPGNSYTTTADIDGTSDDALYQSERSGNTFGYALPVGNGQYTVVLHFAEIFFDRVGDRVFDVSIEGARVLDDYDIFRKTGNFTATTETFVVNVTDGVLNINFSSLASDGGADQAKISAIEILSTSGNQPPVANAGADKTITLPTNSTVLNGSGTDAGGSISSYKWTQVSGPNTANFSSATIAAPTVSGLVAGNYVFSLVVTDNQLFPSAPDQVTVFVNPAAATGTPIYRINAGGGQVTNSRGLFSADASFSPSPGDTYSTATDINGTTDDAIYQSERSGSTGTFAYAFPVSNGQYTVVLHFAEIFFTAIGNRVFDVTIEGTKVLDNYDIVKKVGPYTATTETFVVNVTDGMLNINFSSLAVDGGNDRAKVSAIEILSSSSNQPPVANAGADKSITLPVNSTVLSGSGSDTNGGTITGYKWTQVSGPNTASFSSTTVANPTVSGLIAGSYIFSLVVTDNQLFPSAPDQVIVNVNPPSSTGTPVYRINAGGGQVTTSLGVFSADNFYTPSPGDTYSTVSGIAGTTDDAIYQSERSGSTGAFGYALPVANGQYTVVLHFAEIFFTAINNRVFDVSIEGTKVLDDYDIVKKVGSFAATTEIFGVNVTDGILNINFSSLASDGGHDRAKVSAIEVLSSSSAQAVAVNTQTGSQGVTQMTAGLIQKLTASVQPNPSTNYFNFIITGNNKPVKVNIYNAIGVLIETKTNITVGNILKVGANYRAGLYYAEIQQGIDKVILKFIKQQE